MAYELTTDRVILLIILVMVTVIFIAMIKIWNVVQGFGLSVSQGVSNVASTVRNVVAGVASGVANGSGPNVVQNAIQKTNAMRSSIVDNAQKSETNLGTNLGNGTVNAVRQVQVVAQGVPQNGSINYGQQYSVQPFGGGQFGTAARTSTYPSSTNFAPQNMYNFPSPNFSTTTKVVPVAPQAPATPVNYGPIQVIPHPR